MAKAQQLRAVDEPNVVLPLASSYNERGVAGYTHTVTNSEDQRKVNCFYELAKNPVTGKGTLTLSKREGVTLSGSVLGTTGQTAYLILDLNIGSGSSVIFNKNGNDNRASSGAGLNRIVLTSATYFPAYCDMTAISNAKNGVLQLVAAGVLAQKVYFATQVDISAGNAWTEIVDADFTGLIHIGKMEHMDGFAFILTTSNLIFNSDSNSLANWTATSFLAKQIKQDRAIGLARLSNKLLAFGEETVEGFYNAGNTTGSPLGRIPQLHARIGLVPMFGSGGEGTHYYCTVAGKLYFIGRNARGNSCSLFSFDGFNFDKVSNSYIDKILSEKVVAGSIFSVNSIIINGQNMVGICFTAPGVSPQTFLIFSIDWREWFEWNSSIFSPVNQGQFYLGLGSNQHRIYSFSGTDNWQDDGTSYAWSTQFRLPTNGSSLNYLGMYGVDADTDTSANDLTVSISTNDCVSFSTLGTIDQTQDRKVVIGGGSFRKAHIRLGNTNARPTRIHNFLAGLD